MKKIMTSILIFLIAVTFTACGNTSQKSDKNGYYDNAYVFSGGADQTDANLKDISVSVTKDTNEVVLIFKFVNGSAITTGEEKNMSGLPGYQIACLKNPMRLTLSINNLQYWDYQSNSSWNDTTGLIQGMFRVLPVNSLTSTTFYFNLSSNINYKVEEADGKLTLTLKKMDESAVTGFYATGSLFYEFQNGVLPEGAGLTPTLSNDKISVVMISNRFDKKEDAESFKSRIENSYSSGLAGKELDIVELKTNALPAYDDEMDLQAVLNRNILKVNNKEISLPLFFADARFICWTPDGKKALFAKPLSSSGAEGVPGEQLYLADQDGMKTLLFDAELANIAFASFTNDSKKLAFVEQSGDIMLCSILDMDTKKVKVLGEDIFGGSISGIAWNSESTKLYAMTGTDNMLMLKEYDTATDSAKNMTDYPGQDTTLQCIDNYLYYTDVVDDQETVVKTKLGTDDTTPLLRGNDFEISPNGRYIAVRRLDEISEKGVCDLYIYDTVSKTESEVVSDKAVSEYFFNSDSTALYYFSENEAADAGQYIFSINKYDLQAKTSTHLADSQNGIFSPSNMPNEIIIRVAYTKKSGDYPATYIAKFNK